MKKPKKKFKDTKVFGVLKAGVNIALDVLPIPDPRKYFDKNQDGKIDLTDLRQVRWLELAGAVVLCAALLYFDIIHLDDLVVLLKSLLGG